MLKKKKNVTFFRLEFKKKWAGIKYFGLELIFFNRKSVFLSLFLTFFRQEFKKKWAGILKKWEGIEHFGQELFFF